MKRSKWCKYCNENPEDCRWSFNDVPCTECVEDRDDKIAKQMQNYRDWLAKEIWNARKYRTSWNGDNYIETVKERNNYCPIDTLRECAKQLRSKP